jgi:hypothetical protein
MKMKIKSLVFTILMFLNSVLFSQIDAKDVLFQSNKLYKQGKIEEVIKLLEPVVHGKLLNKEQTFDAYRILALSFMYSLNAEKTDYFMKEMLKLRVDYQKYPNIDPTEFTKLINKYIVRPQIYAGICFGGSSYLPQLMKSYSVYTSDQSYERTSGYQYGGFFEYRLKSNLSVGTDLLINGSAIEHKINDANGWYQQYKEIRKSALVTVVGTKYRKLNEVVNVYCGLGLGMNVLTSSKGNIILTSNQTDLVLQSTTNTISERNKISPVGLVRLGVDFQTNRGKIGFDLTYVDYFNTTVNSEKRYNNADFIFTNQYVSDDIKLRGMMFNLSYKVPVKWVVK